MASNTKGVFPIAPDTQVGLFRTELGDIVSTPLDPEEAGYAEYEYFSDDAIAALLLANPTMPDLAMSKAMTSMARQMLAAAQDIQVDDIKIKTVERASAMMEAAVELAAGAGSAAAAMGFAIVPLSIATSFHPARPQGTPRAFGESGF